MKIPDAYSSLLYIEDYRKDAEPCCPINDKRLEQFVLPPDLKELSKFFFPLPKFHKFCDTI